MYRWFLVVPCLVCLISPTRGDDVVTIESLLREMTTRDTLARLPRPAYTCRQASSYDRDSKSPDDRRGWFANADRSQWVRVEEREVDGRPRREFVMMDEAGPGAIVRFWGTWHGPGGGPFSNGNLRIYLDGNDVPAIEGPIAEVLDGGLLAGPPLSEGVSPETPYAQRGHNLYLPIPYARHCKVTYSTDVLVDRGAQRGEALYYQINYRTYEPGTEVESFSLERLKEAKPQVGEAEQRLTEEFGPDVNSAADSSGVLEPGDYMTARLDGSQAIRQISLRVDAKDRAQAMRSTVLRIEFDGEQCVWVPVGEFFGVGYQPADYKSFYTELDSDGTLVANWAMPFRRSAEVTVENLGNQPVQADLEVKASPWQWDDRSLHFHATWRELYHAETFKGADRPGAGAYDVNFVTIDGQGVYAGDTLTVFNGAAAWWGEGDEKIYVDGERFPSHFGTGSEDYYGYAWCRPQKFASPFHAQPCGDGNVAGGFSVNSRYRGLDAIPFTKSLKFDMELWHWANTKVNYAPTTFFYARPGAAVNVKPDPEAAAREVTTSRGQMGTVYVVDGAIEGEDLKSMATGGVVERQSHGGWGWSSEAQLWWRDGQVGDQLELKFPSPRAGRYRVLANLTEAPDYAEVEIAVNGRPASETIDRYHPEVASTEVDLGEFDLAPGDNLMRVRIHGHNANAIQRGMFGLDYLRLEPR